MKLIDCYKNCKYNTDKAYTHYFLNIYDKFFNSYQDKKLNFLEIGLYDGNSMVLWDDFFQNKETNIYGVDIGIRPKLQEKINNKEFTERVNIHNFDINAIDDSPLKDIKFDIIIEDGSHTYADQLNFIKKFKQILNPGGMFFIEDIESVNTLYKLLAHDRDLIYIDSRNRLNVADNTHRYDDFLIVYFNDEKIPFDGIV